MHVRVDTGPYGRERDERVAAALADAGAHRFAYTVTPGRVRKADGEPHRAFARSTAPGSSTVGGLAPSPVPIRPTG